MDPSTRTFFIAGVKFRPTDDLTRAVQHIAEAKSLADVVVSLVGEPSNKYDRYAVKVIIGENAFVGYIPKHISMDVWALRDFGYRPHASMVSFDKNAPTHAQFEVRVTFEKKVVTNSLIKAIPQ